MNERLKKLFDKDKRNHPWYGRKHSEETKRKIRENHADCSGENNAMYGKKHSEDSLKKMSESHKGYKPTPETLKKMSKAQIRRFQNKENHPAYGKHHSINHRMNIAKSLPNNCFKSDVATSPFISKSKLGFLI